MDLSGTGGLTLTQGLRFGLGTSGSGQTFNVQGPGSLNVSGTIRGDLTTAGATGGTARRLNLLGDATSGQIVTLNPTNGAAWAGVGGITLSGRVTLNIGNAAAVDAGTIVFASGAFDSSVIITGVTSGSVFDRAISFTAGSSTGGTQTVGADISGTGSASFSGGLATGGTGNTVALFAGANDTATFSTFGISGARPIIKTGAGEVVLNVANSYTGSTAVNNGKLTAGVTSALTTTSGITINTGGTLLLAGTGNRIGNAVPLALAGGTLNAGRLSEGAAGASGAGMGALSSTTSGSVIDFGDSAGASVLAFSSIASSAAATVLSVWNWTAGARLYVATGSAATYKGVDFYSTGGTGSPIGGGGANLVSLGGDGFELVPVPEVGALFGVLGLMAPLAYRERRHWMRCREARG